MANKKFLAGMLALALVFGLVLIGCPTEEDDDSGGGGGVSIPVELVAKWYSDVGTTQEALEIKSNGKAIVGGQASLEYDVTVSGGDIKLAMSGAPGPEYKSYRVEGKKLTFTLAGMEMSYYRN